MTTEIKDCPFCGSANIALGYAQQPAQWFFMRCVDCGAQGPTSPSSSPAGGGVPADIVQKWGARAAPSVANGAAELPPLPEIDGLQDIPYALDTPKDWDADYANTWSSLQVAERNKTQWRVYALKLREMLAKQIHAAEPSAEHVAYAEGGKLHWMTGRKLMECELYTAPAARAAIASLDKPVVAMTEGQILDIRDEVAKLYESASRITPQAAQEFARAILAAAGPDAALLEALTECTSLESAEEIRSHPGCSCWARSEGMSDFAWYVIMVIVVCWIFFGRD